MTIDGVNDDSEVDDSEDFKYELKVDAHTKCKSYDVIEAIGVNFDGSFDELKVEESDSCRNMLVQKVERKLEKMRRKEKLNSLCSIQQLQSC